MEISMRAIGVIHSPFHEKASTPIQPTRSKSRGQVEVFSEYAAGLQDVEGFSHLILLYIFHHSQGFDLVVEPFLDDRLHGIFATRYPYRPNPIGLSVVKFVARQGNRLEIDGVDVLDGTPLIDIKPYVAEFDQKADVSSGWFETRSKQ